MWRSSMTFFSASAALEEGVVAVPQCLLLRVARVRAQHALLEPRIAADTERKFRVEGERQAERFLKSRHFDRGRRAFDLHRVLAVIELVGMAGRAIESDDGIGGLVDRISNT